MKPQALEWVEKAEEDYRSMEPLLKARGKSTYNTCCFHAQQCAEKYIKAVLVDMGISPQRTHDIDYLLSKAADFEGSWELLFPCAKVLTDDAVRFRYPGNSATRRMAIDALDSCNRIRDAVRLNLRLASKASTAVAKKRKAHKRRGLRRRRT